MECGLGGARLMKILTAEEMGAADRRSVEAGVSVQTLMRNAGVAVARFCLREYAGDGLIVVLCGKGNNGGDGMVAAAALAAAGRCVRVVLLGAVTDLKDDAAKAWLAATHLSDDETVAKMGHPASRKPTSQNRDVGQPELAGAAQKQSSLETREIADEKQLDEALDGAKLVIDAVVGTGFKPPLRGLAVAARDLLAQMQVAVVAVDLPSGWDADSMLQKGGDGVAAAFRADAVVTFAAPKVAHVFGHLTTGTFGPVVVAGIGTPGDAISSSTNLRWAGAAKRIAETPRDVNGNKGKFGHVLMVGGAWGKAGAPSMASLAAMRAGAGLVTAAVPREILPIVAGIAPELMLVALKSETGNGKSGAGSGESGTAKEQGGLALEQLEKEPLAKLLKGITVVGIGPGLGQEGATPEFVRTFVERVSLPMVIDADALNAWVGRAALLGDIAKGAVKTDADTGTPRTIVLTPHPGEMARLVGMSVKEVEVDRVGLARRFATKHGVTLVLKGWRTLIAHPDGRVAVNTTGNPSMAKGGSGDILTGIVAAMLAQYGGAGSDKQDGEMKPEDVAQAVEAAVFLHGLAGDFACLEQEEHTVLATDAVDHLWQAFRARVCDDDGFTWIAGLAAAGSGGRGGARNGVLSEGGMSGVSAK
jgi:hydroxyethylthiazole kinase-like uncharacterized protein yjeF